MKTLKACPKCGESEFFAVYSNSPSPAAMRLFHIPATVFQYACGSCGFTAPEKETGEEARKAWNEADQW